jgi:tetratricopeptide (TPR) repeat protein
MGELYNKLGKVDESTKAHEEAIAIARDGDMPLGTALLTASFGDSLVTLGLPERAVEQLRSAAHTLAAMGDRQNEAQVMQSLASAHESLGEIEQAERCRAHAERLLLAEPAAP